MAKKFGFFNSINGDRKYLASDISQAFDIGVTTGIKAEENNLKVVAYEGMQVQIQPGSAMIFGHFFMNDEPEIITIDTADAELNRIDRIVLRYDAYTREVNTAVIKGSPALSPTPPAILRTNEQYDLVLADLYVPVAATEIGENNITDTRNDPDLCGYIGVKGAVSQLDFDAHLAESASDNVHGLAWSDYTELTLLNGWTGSLRVRKNDALEMVFIYGEISPGVTDIGTTITTLSPLYRPARAVALPAQSAVINIGAITGLAIVTSGNLNIYGEASNQIGNYSVRINYMYRL